MIPWLRLFYDNDTPFMVYASTAEVVDSTIELSSMEDAILQAVIAPSKAPVRLKRQDSMAIQKARHQNQRLQRKLQ